uniref:Uncharacterized protein n=1 Tax=Zooxanthella nutricula TaxID=1333877 RepID=A0A7S2NXX6_9DINO
MLQGSSAVAVPPVAVCEHLRRDALPGYKGFIPGKRADTVFGERFSQVNAACHAMRPRPQETRTADHTWRCPPEVPTCRRGQGDVYLWAMLQQETPWINGGRQPRSHGPATLGYGGHDAFRQSRAEPLVETLGGGRRHELSSTMRTDRDCHPFDVHRPALPGYSGHLRQRSIQ